MRELNDARVVQDRARLGLWQITRNRGNRASFTWIFILVAMAVSTQLAGCAGTKSPYVIQDTGLHAEASGNELVWLDNHRVRFYGYQDWKPQGPEFHGVPQLIGADYYIWNTEIGQLVTEPSLDGVKGICVQGEVLSFVKKSAAEGSERLVVTRVRDQDTVRPLVNAQWFNRFSCLYYEQKPEWDRGHASLPLLEGTSSLFFKYSLENNPILFFHPNSEKGVPLSIGTRQVWHNLVRYAPFKNAYLLYPVAYIDPQTGKEEPIGPWPNGKSVPMWWLAPDGTVTTEEVPYMSFMRGGSRAFFPTRSGIFVSTHKTDDLWKPGEAGGYLAKDRKVVKLITGMLTSVTVSPDGCKVAFLHDPYVKQPVFERVKVKVINVCEETHHVR